MDKEAVAEARAKLEAGLSAAREALDALDGTTGDGVSVGSVRRYYDEKARGERPTSMFFTGLVAGLALGLGLALTAVQLLGK